jgi:hypothetical protein
MQVKVIELTQPSARLFDTSSVRSAWWAVVARFLIHGLVVSTWVSRIPAIQTALGLTNARLGQNCVAGLWSGPLCNSDEAGGTVKLVCGPAFGSPADGIT